MDDRKKAVYYRLMQYDEIIQQVGFKIEALYGKKLIEKNPEFIFSGCYLDRENYSCEYPKYDKLLRDAQDGKFDVIVLRNISDFPGNVKDFLQFVTELHTSDHPVRVISLFEGFDTEKSNDYFFTLCSFVYAAYSEKEVHHG